LCDYVEFASENYGDGNLADTNNNNLGNTPAEIQRNQKLVNNNNQDYAGIDKSKDPWVRFQSFSYEACRVRERLKSFPRVSEISLSCTFSGV
jgi:hypothetical protein